ncbi:Metallo-hydrolase/oxidoreductase [Mycena maculata]|uniref:Metallo-hydrolase/oxidoreductase n=1 Tax=Mycena maculata TaxID=230809 RepID=A0AAD7MNP6_9AGAR|nr:Metallo-hydrolase/oxidoreductase [Mycena maculata]
MFTKSSLISSAKCSLGSLPLKAHQPKRLLSRSTLRPTSARQYASVAQSFQCYPSQSPDSPTVYSFFERDTFTMQYIVSDPTTKDAALIDTVLDYDPASGTISTTTADEILAFIGKCGLNIKYILETHAHADHLSAARYYRNKFNVPVGVGKRISTVQEIFAPIYGLESSSFVDAFDLLFQDDESFQLGALNCRVIHLGGHTPDHVGYVIGQSAFTGDSIFQPDVGSARSDFPGGDAKSLYSSMQRLMALPESYRLFVGHDYPVDRQPIPVSTVGEQLLSNNHIRKGINEFISFRNSRDLVLGAPRLLHPSLQTNIRGGKLPPPDGLGRFSFRIPITTTVAL